MLDQDKELPNDSGGLSSYNNFIDKKQNASANKQYFFAFSALNWVFTYRHSKSEVYKRS